jgi:hypothetical protein
VSGEYHENYDGLKHLGRLFGLLAALGRPLGLGVAKGSAGGVRFAVETTCPGEALSPTACGRRDEVQGLQVL